MRTRNADTPKPTPTPTPPATKPTPPPAKKPALKKTPIKTPPKPSPEPSSTTPDSSTTPKSPAPSTGAKQKTIAASSAAAAKQVVTTTPKTEPKVEEGSSASVDVAAQVTPEVKAAAPVAAKTIVKRIPAKTTKGKAPAAAATAAVKASPKTPNPVEPVRTQIEPSPKEEPVVEATQSPATKETGKQKVTEPLPKSEGHVVEDVKTTPTAKPAAQKAMKPRQAVKPGVKKVMKKVEPVAKKVEVVKEELTVVENVGGSSNEEEPTVSKAVESIKKDEANVSGVAESDTLPEVAEVAKINEAVPEVVESLMEDESAVAKVAESPMKDEGEEVEEVEGKIVEELKAADDANASEVVGIEEEPMEVEEAKVEEEKHNMDEGMIDFGEQESFLEPGDEEFAEDDASEPDEGTGGPEAEQQKELSDIANERKIKKELEVFVGGLDRDAVEDDVKKAFEKVGEVVEVRLLKNPATNKNKGFAFVKFATKEQASKALSELKNPVIRGRRCGVARSEDNDTLFVGNICNTWTKEAIKQKMKDYGVEGVENITLVPDAQHEGLSRGFAFIEFSCHADAMLAYKRLQKPDAVFGHPERTVKVGFAEPLRDPDPEIMAQVKSVFVDGLPPYWDEEQVREHFKSFGEIERIVLARNMPTAKRKDFGFVDYTTHDAAVACIEGVNQTELGDGKLKSKVKVRFASPLPKTQAVKGGLCGGFRIGHAGTGVSSRFGRGVGRGGPPYDRASYQHDRGFSARGRGRASRYGFPGRNDFESMSYGFPEQKSYGGRGVRRDYGPYGEEFASSAASSSRPGMDWPRHGGAERGRGSSLQYRRQPFSPEGHYTRPYGVRDFVDDPHMYEPAPGLKRPYSMMDHEPGYLEPSRLRPRYDYPDPAVSSSSGIRYQGSYGADADIYSHQYSGSDYGGRTYSSSMYGGDRSYGGGYYY